MNILLYKDNEDFLKYLDPEKAEIKEVKESGQLSTLSLIYPLTNAKADITYYFKPGHKILLVDKEYAGFYVINENITYDIYGDKSIEVILEDVLVELNYAPMISELEFKDKYKLMETVSEWKTALKEWFGDYYDIGKVNLGSISNILSLKGSMSLMNWLRSIEEQTGNYFIPEYSYNSEKKVIQRKLNFLNPAELGRNKNLNINVGFNADNIKLNIDESEAYNSVSPLISYDSTNNDLNHAKAKILLKEWKDLQISKGTQYPKVLNKYTNAFPHNVGTGQDLHSIEGLIDTSNQYYWRRNPEDSTYDISFTVKNVDTNENWTPKKDSEGNPVYYSIMKAGTYNNISCSKGDHLVHNGSNWVKVDATVKNSNNIEKIGYMYFIRNVSTYADYKTICTTATAYTHPLGYYYCAADIHQNDDTAQKKIASKGNIIYSEGTSWRVKTNFSWTEGVGLTKSVFLKNRGENNIYRDTFNNANLDYDDIYTKSTKNFLYDGDRDNDLDWYTYDYDTPEDFTEDIDEPGEEADAENSTFAHISNTKNKTVDISETNVYAIFQKLTDELLNNLRSKVEVEVDLSEIKDHNISLYDKMDIFVHDTNNPYKMYVQKTEKNPHLPDENTVTLSSIDDFNVSLSKDSQIELSKGLSVYWKDNKKHTYTGVLSTYEEAVNSKGENYIKETPIPNARITLLITAPDFKKPYYNIQKTTKTTNTSSAGVGKQTVSKWGVTKDKKSVIGIGQNSTGRDKIPYKQFVFTVAKNRCPNPKCTNPTKGLVFHAETSGATHKKGKKAPEGEFTCTSCDCDYSVEGWEKYGRNIRLKFDEAPTKIDRTKALKARKQISKGKYEYGSATTTKTKKTKTTKTEKKVNYIKVDGSTYHYTTKTDKNGKFSFSVTLKGTDYEIIDNKPYTFKYIYGGDVISKDDEALIIDGTTVTQEVTIPGKWGATVTTVKNSSSSKNKTNEKWTPLPRKGGHAYVNTPNKEARQLAQKIIGKSTGLAAIKKIAAWVGSSKIKYRKYFDSHHRKNPYNVIKKSSSIANCCDHANLFAYLCEASGQLKNGEIEVWYVYGPGHCWNRVRYKKNNKWNWVTVDCVTKGRSWGHTCKDWGSYVNKKASIKYPVQNKW